MKELKTTSKQANKLRYAYINGVNIIHELDIYKIYDNPSKEKIELLHNYLEDIRKRGGYQVRILSYNKFNFTLGYLMDKLNTTYLYIITKYNKEIRPDDIRPYHYIAFSCGTYGRTGLLLYSDKTSKFYKICSRTANLYVF